MDWDYTATADADEEDVLFLESQPRMPLAEIKINDFGGAPVCQHNMPCTVCGINHAVRNMNTGRFDVCWSCQRRGWAVVHMPRWMMRIFNKLFRRA
jgi:hypothetical protein